MRSLMQPVLPLRVQSSQSADFACLEYNVDNLVETFNLPQQLQGAEDS